MSRHEPDGREDGKEYRNHSSLHVMKCEQESEKSSQLARGNTRQEEAPSNNQLSDDSLEEDVYPSNHAVANVSRDNATDTVKTECKASSIRTASASDATDATTCTKRDEATSKTTGGTSVHHDGADPVSGDVHVTGQAVGSKGDMKKATESRKQLQNNSTTSLKGSSRASSCASRIPVLEVLKSKPSPLADPSTTSRCSVTMNTRGEHPHNEENRDTPISVALGEVPSCDSLHSTTENTGCTKIATDLSNKQKEAAVTIQAYYRGWSTRKSVKRPSQLPVAKNRQRQDGRVLKNTNSFNSYIHEQMAITMAMMEANFKGVGLSNTQQERVEELRAGLDSFSLTSITAASESPQKEQHHHGNLPTECNMGMDHDRMEISYGNGTGMDLMHRSLSYSNNTICGRNIRYQRQSTEVGQLSRKDSDFETRRRGSYLQQQVGRRGSYVQQSKLAQSIKSLRPPKLKPLPRRQSSNYLQAYIAGKATYCSGNREWNPDHVMPPLDESTPISHAQRNPVTTIGNHMINSGYLGDDYYGNCYLQSRHHYPTLPNIGESYSITSLYPVKPHESYQQQCPGPPPHAVAYPKGGHYYAQRNYWRRKH